VARLIVSVNKNALKYNLQMVRESSPNTKVMAMVKANAYGHGLVLAAKAFHLADAFGVATLDEAITLRKNQITKPIVLMQGILSLNALRLVVKYDITVVVHHSIQLDLLKDTSSVVKVWVKVNTGFNRLGFQPNEIDTVINRLEASSISIQGIMTHYAKANECDDVSTKAQLYIFTKLIKKYDYPVSISNSAGILNYPNTIETWIRPGLMLYGVSPFSDKCATDLNLEPAMTLKSQLISTYVIKKGQKVGYGAHYTAQKDLRIGIVSIGYGDGYHWLQNAPIPVVINGERAHIIGQVAMDMIAISLENITSAHVGDYVTLWGDGLFVEDIAQQLSTSPYVLLCSAPTEKERAMREAKESSLSFSFNK